MFTFSERHMTVCGHVTVYHYNDTWLTVTRRSFDDDQRHVTAFRPTAKQLIVGHTTIVNYAVKICV